MNKWLADHVVCPRDKQSLESQDNDLVCPGGHKYALLDGIPIMLVDDAESTHGYIDQSLKTVEEFRRTGRSIDSGLPISDGGIDPFVQAEVPYTSGTMYFAVQNRLPRYPIPETRLGLGRCERLLDVGCNWGRWTIAAARKGYKPVGLDPSLKAVFAARRVAAQLGVEADFVVGDARYLPFREDSFDVVFSYGVYQHLSKENVRIALTEDRRVLRTGGRVVIQMPNRYGLRQYQQLRRRGFTEGEGFDIRYWTPSEMMETFRKTFGPTEMSTDCYFGLGIQGADVDLLPAKYKAVVYSSEILRKVSSVIRPLTKLADSVYLESINKKQSPKVE